MNNPDVYIRVDGNPEIGLGHIYRCIALAQMLKGYFKVSFWSVEIPAKTHISIKEIFGYELNLLENNEEFLDLLKEEQDRSIVIVLDGYHFNTQFQMNLKGLGLKIVCIDDIHDKHFVSDVVINHGLDISKHKYSVERNTSLYLGPDYALLRKEFIKLTKGEQTLTGELESAFLCFGGSDPLGFTEKVLRALIRLKGIKKINAITGGGFQKPEAIDEIKESSSAIISHYHNIGDQQMAALMNKSDFAIVPSSTILYEVIAARLPVITGFYTDNQAKLYKGILNEGAARGIGKFTIDSIDRVLQELTLAKCQQIQKNQRKIIDGRSPQRIMQIFQELT